MPASPCYQNFNKQKKKILILCSNGGYTHNAAATTLRSLLEEDCDFTTIYPIELLTFLGLKTREEIYNNMLQSGWVRTMNVISEYIAPQIFKTRNKKIEAIISDYIKKERPDLVISLIPFINYPATEAARKHHVPYLLITVDNDLRTWVHGLKNIKHRDFKVTVGIDLPSTRGLLKKHSISDEAIKTIGFPIRGSFYKTVNPQEIFQVYNIPENKPVILLMMGGVGGSQTLAYTAHIGKLDLGAHLIVCTGKNETLAKKIKTFPLHSGNSISVVGFTDKISELMAIANVFVTKAGPSTFNEAIAKRVPILIDNTPTPLIWEKINISLVLKYGIGDQIQNLKEVGPLLRKYLYDNKKRTEIEKAFCLLPPNRFHEEIKSLVHSMCL